ncbi:MAG: hypothetical protein LBV29_04380 [Azoarcus sp.]|jgi:hypothetical protein|nr:hypothetical protein [Azoarcus sp.]
MNEHWVVICVNQSAKTFTATARKQTARLQEVDDWAQKNGFTTRTVVAQNIDESQAKSRKGQEIANYTRKGYTYVSRPPL